MHLEQKLQQKIQNLNYYWQKLDAIAIDKSTQFVDTLGCFGFKVLLTNIVLLALNYNTWIISKTYYLTWT